jgi:hypothetical protein
MLALQLGEERRRLEPRIHDESRFDSRPNLGEGDGPHAPRAPGERLRCFRPNTYEDEGAHGGHGVRTKLLL